MRVLKIILFEGMYTQTYDFSTKTQIYSEKNTQGKTTLIRLLLHSIGFQIPDIEGINFRLVTTEVELESKNQKYTIVRRGNLVKCIRNFLEYTFDLPDEFAKLYFFIHDIENEYLINNLLGSFYIDQTKGGVILNRGDVIGNITFSIDRLISGLQGTDISSQVKLLDEEKSKLKEYNILLKLAEVVAKNDIQETCIEDFKKNDNLDKVMSEINFETSISRLKRKIEQIDKSIRSNKAFIENIENYGLYVKTDDNQIIAVNKENIVGYNENSEILAIQKKMLNGEKNIIERDLLRLKEIQKNDSNTITFEEELNDVANYFKTISINYFDLNRIVLDTKKRIKRIEIDIKHKIATESNLTSWMNDQVISYAKELNVSKYIDKSGILTHKVQNKSGTDFIKLIIAFKVVFIKAWEKKTGILLPLIVDSVRNYEVSQENAKVILNFISNHIPNHQLIMASIFRYNDFFDQVITLNGRVIHTMNNNMK